MLDCAEEPGSRARAAAHTQAGERSVRATGVARLLFRQRRFHQHDLSTFRCGPASERLIYVNSAFRQASYKEPCELCEKRCARLLVEW